MTDRRKIISSPFHVEFQDQAVTKLIRIIQFGVYGGMAVRPNIESVAIKNLRGILSERGMSAEALFEKYDQNGDGTLSKGEFESALRSITGQVAPNAIVNAVFGALDQDSSGKLELVELLSLVEAGSIQTISKGDAIKIVGHPNEIFNGIYAPQEGSVNGRDWYGNEAGNMLYFFSGNEGASSWNLDDRTQDGSNDWYRGGWTRATSGDQPPIGVRRWVGVGKLTLSPIVIGLVEPGEDNNFKENNEKNGLGDLLTEIEAATVYFEEQVSEGNMTVDQAMLMADSAFERKSQQLLPFMREPARKAWDEKMRVLESKLRAGLPASSKIAAGTAGLGVIGAVSSSLPKNSSSDYNSIPPRPDFASAIPEPEPAAADIPPRPPFPSENSEPEVQEDSEPEVQEDSEPEVQEGPGPEVLSSLEESPHSSFDLELAISGFQQARTLTERSQVMESVSGKSGPISIRVNSVERTFGIGISDLFRGGNTLVAEVKGVGDVEIRMPTNSSESAALKSGYEGVMEVSIADWNAVRRRLVLESQ